jgi:hypothetical protein
MVLQRFLLACLFLILSGCGGGGTTSTSPSSSSPPTSSTVITLSQSILKTSVPQWSYNSISILATVNDPNIFAGASAIYVVIIDKNQVLTGSVGVTALSKTQFSLSFTTSNRLNPGQYTGNFEIHVCKDAACKNEFLSPLILPYEFTVTEVPIGLSSTQPNIDFGGIKGRDWSTASFNFKINTYADIGTSAWEWKIDNLPSWLSSNKSTGRVGLYGDRIELRPDPSKLPPGKTSASFSISTTINGHLVTLPVTANINIDQEKLLSSEYGVGLSSTSLGNVVSRSVTISNNFGKTVNWNAYSDSGWLSATSSGNTANGKLNLVADPAKLVDGLQYATVTVSSEMPGVQPVKLKIAAWKSSNIISPQTKLPLNDIYFTFNNIVADKIRPYIYMSNFGGVIDVYNVYTGTKIKSITIKTNILGNMAVSPDGARLFVNDIGNGKIAVIDLMTLTLTESWDVPWLNSHEDFELVAIRPNNEDILLLNNNFAYASNGKLVPIQIKFNPLDGFKSMVASANSRRIYALNVMGNDARITAMDVDYTTISNGILLLENAVYGQENAGPVNGLDIATNADGSKLYAAMRPNSCSLIDEKKLITISQLPGGGAIPNSIEVANDGKVICGISNLYSQFDIWVHNADGQLMKAYKVAALNKLLRQRQLIVTPDSMMLVAVTGDPSLVFLNIAQ